MTTAEANLDAAIDWNQQMQLATDGQVLFQNNCARCHTRGWSYFDPNEPLANPLPSPMGSGAFGPNLTDGDVDRQFPPPNGESELFSWIAIGVAGQPGLRDPGHLVGAHAALRFRADEDPRSRQIMAYERSL